MTLKVFIQDDVVRVIDPDGERWIGTVLCPSPLWDGWYVVRKISSSNNGATRHVHSDDMKERSS